MSSANGLRRAAEVWRKGTRSLEPIIRQVSASTLLEDLQGCLDCMEAVQEMHDLIDAEVRRRASALDALSAEKRQL